MYTKGQADTTFTKQGGYSGTAHQLSTTISEVSSRFDQFKADGQSPTDIGVKTQENYSGLNVSFTAYYSPITHLVVIRGGLHGKTTSTLAAGAHQLGTIAKKYAPANYDFQAICDYNFGNSNDGARLEVKQDGTIQLRNWAQVNSGQPVDSDACVSYYALSQ